MRGKKPRPLAERFWEKVDKNGPVPAHVPELGPCWIWTGHVTDDGYGQMQIGSRSDDSRRKERAHRVAWYLAHGRWPSPCGLHKCDNRKCVREGHLFEGTNAANVSDRNSKQRQSRGEGRPGVKLTDVRARELMRRKAEGATTRELAEEFGISKSQVSTIGRKSWLHVAEPEQQLGMSRYGRRHGADHSNAKITEEQAREIILRRGKGEPLARLAREFGISATGVARLGVTTWLHLTNPTETAQP